MEAIDKAIKRFEEIKDSPKTKFSDRVFLDGVIAVLDTIKAEETPNHPEKPETSSGEKPDRIKESNKMRDNIISILEDHPSTQAALYPLLHYFESELTRLREEHQATETIFHITLKANEKLREENASLKAENDSRKFC